MKPFSLLLWLWAMCYLELLSFCQSSGVTVFRLWVVYISEEELCLVPKLFSVPITQGGKCCGVSFSMQGLKAADCFLSWGPSSIYTRASDTHTHETHLIEDWVIPSYIQTHAPNSWYTASFAAFRVLGGFCWNFLVCAIYFLLNHGYSLP